MSEPENFLNRWSRRKRAPEAKSAPTETAPTEAVPPNEAAPETPAESGEAVRDSKPAVTKAPQAPVPEFDVSSLPSLDSIDAQTDIRVFLQAGVPSDLRLAALRRAWTADPAIRNFKGLAENDWDFNDPNSMTGFGPLDPGTDVKKMLARLFSGPSQVETKEPPTELPPPDQQTALAAPETATEAGPAAELSEPTTVDAVQVEELPQREGNIAVQDDGDEDDGSRPRSHGGALPH
jgi:Protein of unknown function (DUF3306)